MGSYAEVHAKHRHPDSTKVTNMQVDLRNLLTYIACEISRNGWGAAAAPSYLKTFCAGEVMAALPRALTTKLFAVYAKNQCKFMESRFLDAAEHEMLLKFEQQQQLASPAAAAATVATPVVVNHEDMVQNFF